MQDISKQEWGEKGTRIGGGIAWAGRFCDLLFQATAAVTMFVRKGGGTVWVGERRVGESAGRIAMPGCLPAPHQQDAGELLHSFLSPPDRSCSQLTQR